MAGCAPRSSGARQTRRSACWPSSTSSTGGSATPPSRAARSSTCCSEADADHPARAASVAELANVRSFLEGLARDAGAADPDGLARSWHLLMKGAIIAAAEHDADAARRAQHIGRLLLAEALA